MQGQNISDVIEKYFKKILLDEKAIVIKRSEVAELFNCVPSQINYVINTRFTIQNGYVVESKRGGGGYIKIEKVNLFADQEFIQTLENLIGTDVSQQEGYDIIQSLYDEKTLTKKESNLILATIKKDAFLGMDTNLENTVRAKMLINLINRLRYEE
ncbi:CtsR family transcriptional regulator [Dellaglioa algida]|nr:CtsR family transcriptional regulator [Dellaglioa algida]MDK1733380.1 CtsR family transcriptional regulator [Dellaglioa algida]MDK1734902.1 CtsR family transcriptional regulator [Dellaglioa algida]